MEIHGAVQWLISAYEDYRNRVANRTIGYKAFLEENLVKLSMPVILREDTSYSDLLQETIDRDKVKHILEDKKFTESFFCLQIFEEADAIRMIAKYNMIGMEDSTELSCRVVPLSDYPSKVKNELAEVFNKHALLSPSITPKDLEALLTTGNPSCKYTIPPYAKNVDIGIILNILLRAGALTRNWSSIICGKGNLLASSGVPMQSKNLSAATHQFDSYEIISISQKQMQIAHDVKTVLSALPNVIKNL